MGNTCGCGTGKADELRLDDENLYFFQDGHLWHNRIDEIIAYRDSQWLKQVIEDFNIQQTSEGKQIYGREWRACIQLGGSRVLVMEEHDNNFFVNN